MRSNLFMGVALAALIVPGAALAQSTGSVDFENDVVVTGSKVGAVGGVESPDTSKTREVLTDRFIQHQVAGQSVDEIINMMPGVSFQNNDPYGSSGGTLTIRGFDASRISQTVDGIPLNDTGNYAIYSNQQLDPELIEQVSVALGSTDVDSPTASATGATVNYRTRNPTQDFHIRMLGSAGEYGFMRIFGVLDTGAFTASGTRAFISASSARNYNPYNPTANIDKTQANFKLYQPYGENGDFISIAGTYNNNKNNNFSSSYLRTDPTILTVTGTAPNQVVTSAPRVVGTASTNNYPTTKAARFYSLGVCQTDVPQPGVADVPNTCGTGYDYSYNPSINGNIRIASRFTLAQGLVLTVDPSYQYVKANGGASAVKGNEGFYGRAVNGTTAAITTPLSGYIGGNPYFGGVDLNRDGDTLDGSTRNPVTGALTNTTQGVELYAPSQTGTNRFIVNASLRYELSDTQTVRAVYTYDHGRHRQTGEVGYLLQNGYAANVFPIDNPILGADGKPIEKRNRLSFAILNQVSGEYRGQFLDSHLTVNLGVRAPFFKRDLNNYCVSESGSNIGFVDCFNNVTMQAAFLAANPTYQAPQQRVFNYSKVLPNGGLTYDLTNQASVYANYSRGLQVPGTDNLYNSFAFARGTAAASPVPETSDNFELGLRYRSSKIQASVAGWYTLYNNRLASSYDPTLDVTIYRNLGRVDKYGIDANIAYQPIHELLFYAFGSYLKSKIRDNVVNGECTAANIAASVIGCAGGAVGQTVYAYTAGKRESGAPTYSFGGRIEGNFGPLEIGAQAKRTGPRYLNDQNLPLLQSYTLNGTTAYYQVYGAKAPAYTVVDLDARLSLGFVGLNDTTYFQLNVTNLFDTLYVGGFGGTVSNTTVKNAYISPPRAVSGSINVAF